MFSIVPEVESAHVCSWKHPCILSMLKCWNSWILFSVCVYACVFPYHFNTLVTLMSFEEKHTCSTVQTLTQYHWEQRDDNLNETSGRAKSQMGLLLLISSLHTRSHSHTNRTNNACNCFVFTWSKCLSLPLPVLHSPHFSLHLLFWITDRGDYYEWMIVAEAWAHKCVMSFSKGSYALRSESDS